MNSTTVFDPPGDVAVACAEQAVQSATMVNARADLPALLPDWKQAGMLGLDTEFVRERTFFPRPGLVQLSDGRLIWLIDPIGRDDFSCLAEILADRNITKILHSVGEDLEIFRLLTGTLPAPLFDTQIAAAMLGLPLQCRYEHLVQQSFGVELPGGQARSDWCKRPLAPSLLEYAAQDVIWLPRLCSELGEALDRRNRLSWLQEDCQRLVQRAATPDQDLPLLRVKGAGRLDDRALGWLEILARWRDTQARERDLPRGFVLRDDMLVDLAARADDSTAFNQVIEGMPHPLKRRYRQVLESLIASQDPGDFERPPELVNLTQDQRHALKLAQQEVLKLAEDLELEPALIASKRELTRLVRGEHPDWLDGWRGKVLGDLPTRLKA